MAGSSFGTLFRVTTFGESHCRGVGCIVDGCPPGLLLSEDDIQPQLTRRRPGQSRLTTPRSETDLVTIMSGTERGVTLGTPIALFVPNENVRPQDYKEMDAVPRPGHADYTYQMKYGIRASSGGGRSSARETIGRVAAGAIAEKWLAREYGTQIVSFVSAIGTVQLAPEHELQPDGRPWSRNDVDTLGTLVILTAVAGDEEAFVREYNASSADAAAQELLMREFSGGAAAVIKSPPAPGSSGMLEKAMPGLPAYEGSDGTVYDMHGAALPGVHATDAIRSPDVIAVRCPHAPTACRMASLIRAVKSARDSTGGVMTTTVGGVPIGLGEPCFDKLQALLAHAMLSLPAVKGFELGSGFRGSQVRGSVHNDTFLPATVSSSQAEGGMLLRTATNHAGGTLGGISNGAPLLFRVAIKPVSTIGRPQATCTYDGSATVLEAKGRHDPCVLPRVPPLVEAMTALVLADTALIQRSRGLPLRCLPSPDEDSHEALY